jgi:hypothetical protein
MTKVSEKSSDIRRSVMQVMLYIAGGHGPLQKRIGRAEKETGFKRSRLKHCWYADPRVAVRIEELQRARTAALEVARDEERRATELVKRLEALQDQDLDSVQVNALRIAALG